MRPNHLFVDTCDGAMHDTRAINWHLTRPLRADYQRTHSEIRTMAEFKATLRNGAFAWPGGYPLYLICSDGAPLCFDCGRKEARYVLHAIDHKDGSGWRVVACEVNWEDGDLHCEHCNKRIDSAYAEE